jgi:hypothetical protein
MRSPALLFLITLLFSGCSKDNADTTKPAIVISSPADKQVFTAGQTVNVAGVVTDNDEIHAVHLYVNNKANNAEIIHLEEHVDKSTYTLARSFTAQAGTTYTIKIEADDHSSNESELTLEVSAK